MRRLILLKYLLNQDFIIEPGATSFFNRRSLLVAFLSLFLIINISINGFGQTQNMYWTFNESSTNCSTNILITSPSNGNITGSYSITDGCSSTVTGTITTESPFVTINSGGNAIQNFIAKGETKYWYFALSGSDLANLSNINVYFQLYNTEKKELNAQIDYSIDGGINYIGAQSISISSFNKWTAQIFDFSSIPVNSSSLIFRIQWSQNAGNSGRDNYVSVDNFQVQGTLIATCDVIAQNVTGGGAYCSGDAGVAVGLDDSETGVTYTLYRDGTSTGISVDGSGSAINFGNQTVAGTYTVIGHNVAENCDVAMNGTASVVINPSPTLSAVNQDADVCEGSPATINLTGLVANSTFTLDYSIDGTPQTPVTGLIADGSGNSSFSTSNLIASDDGKTLEITDITITSSSPNCTQSFSGISTSLSVLPTEVSVSISASPSGSVCPGTTVTYTATPSNNVTSPSYQWMLNGINVGTNSNTYSYIPVDGDEISCTLTMISDSPCLADPPFTYFSWNNTSKALTDSDYGLDASSINDGQYLSGGVDGTNCLAPVVQNANILLVFDGTENALNSDGLDFRISYRRAENSANLFTRGSSLNISGGANFGVTYLIDNGSGTTTVTSPDFVINDLDNFHDYRFRYSPVDGFGRLYIDDVQVWESSSTPGMPMYWTGAGDLMIGEGLDASGNQTPSLDNLSIAVVGKVTASDLITVQVSDNEDPIPDIATLPDISAECSVATLTAPTATDNCAGSITGTHNATLPITAQGTTTITWTYDDGNGNTVTQTQNVVINDVTDPTINCPTDINQSVDPGSCQATGVSLGMPVSADNCSVASVTNNAPVSFPLGTTVVTWTATDIAGNPKTCTQNVIIVPEEDIEIVVQDLADFCQSGQTGITTVTWNVSKPTGTSDWSYNYTISDGFSDVASSNNVNASGDITISYNMSNQSTNKTLTLTLTNVKDDCGINEINVVNNSDSVTLYNVPATSEIQTD